jgi:hypothetical protein
VEKTTEQMMEDEIRSLARTVKNADEELGQALDEYEQLYGENQREWLEESLL